MKKLWAFVLGAAASSALLTGAVVATVFWAIISVIINGGHPWPYDNSGESLPDFLFFLLQRWCFCFARVPL